MSFLVPLPIVLPMTAAAAMLLFRRRVRIQRAIGVCVLAAVTATSFVLLARAHDSTLAVRVGDWPAQVGIALVVDVFSALLIVVSALTLLAVYVYALGRLDTQERNFGFHPLYMFLSAGVFASFLTGDLFNLFVAFEITLAASFVLITLGGKADQVRTGMTYVAMNVLGSTLFLTAIGLTYAATGTVNMAQLVERFAQVPDGVRLAIGLLFLVAFGLKAAIFPLFQWLPDSYPTAPTPVTAVFAGLLTKVGVYAIVRTQAFYFAETEGADLLLVIAALTMVVGVLGAIAQNDIKRLLSFHIVSQIGYMVMGIGLLSVSGLAATIFFMCHQIPVKTALFLTTGIIERRAGTASLHGLGGLSRVSPALGALFLLPALSLAGIPPFSGFLGKLGLVRAGIEQSQYWIVAISLLVSLCTLFSMTKIWNGAFWGPPSPTVEAASSWRLPRIMRSATAALVALTIFIVVFARPITELADQAASELLDPGGYVEAVLG